MSLATGRRLWGNRFGRVTSFRIPAQAGLTPEFIEEQLVHELNQDAAAIGFAFTPVKRQQLAASQGTTPFDALFLALSFFIIAAALMLVALLFRLGVEQCAEELGTLLAVGLRRRSVAALLILEAVAVAAVGGLAGLLIGMGYARLMLFGLRTWWLGAITAPFVDYHATSRSLGARLQSRCVRLPDHYRLEHVGAAARLDSPPARRAHGRGSRLARSRSLGSVGCGFALGGSSVAARRRRRLGRHDTGRRVRWWGGRTLGGPARCALVATEAQWHAECAGCRYGTCRAGLAKRGQEPDAQCDHRRADRHGQLPDRGDQFLSPGPHRYGRRRISTRGGKLRAGFRRSQQRIGSGRAVRRAAAVLQGSTLFGLRLRAGDDASCNNLYQPSQPRVLGIPPDFIGHFDDKGAITFAWSSTAAASDEEHRNPWRLLEQKRAAGDDAIPTVIDMNTAFYSLKPPAMVGSVYETSYEAGKSLRFRVVGLLENSMLQGSLIIGEADFERCFPEVSGYRYFLIKTPANQTDQVRQVLEDRLGDEGFDAEPADAVLAQLLAVQNAYLSTFQSLGTLGLLFGTFGLATVQIRNVVERRGELALLRATGFGRRQLARLVLYENVSLLAVGLSAGVFAALLAILPHKSFGEASIPWSLLRDLSLMLAGVFAAGVIASFASVRAALRAPLLQALRRE